MNFLIIGGGGREHCLAWKLASSALANKIYAIPGNPGIARFAECADIPTGKEGFKAILEFVRHKNIDFTVVGPEAPLVDGIVDSFEEKGHKIFGPGSSAARLEGSKVFTKELCKKYKIPTAGSIKFERRDYASAKKYIERIKEDDFPVVLKVDGLAAGKGVIIAQNKVDALSALEDCFIKDVFKNAADSLIIEQFIRGYEVSMLSLCDGKDIVPMVPAQDYKKIFDKDEGKNTGGMGSYSPVPLVSGSLQKKILDEIIYPSYDAILSEKINYTGVLYAGIIIKDGQPYLLEFNCRFGDPETQAIIPRLESDLGQVLLDCTEGKIADSSLKWDDSKCICVVLASKGYPETSSSGDLITGLDRFSNTSPGQTLVFHAGTKIENEKIYTNGGRVLGVAATGETFKNARKKVYESVSNIYFDGMQYRTDIALNVEKDTSL